MNISESGSTHAGVLLSIVAVWRQRCFAHKIMKEILCSGYRLTFLTSVLLALLASWTGPVRAVTEQQEGAQLVYVLTFEGAITPVLERYLQEAIDAGLSRNAEALVLQLDTPGGSVDVTKSIVQTMLGAPIPVIVYVAPAGAHAGSAGTFVTLAAHAAAMAPGTSIGAASPVGAGGEDVGETMEAKVKNILSADIENLAARRGEAATEWAIAAVQEASAATANQAMALGVVDVIAIDLLDLAAQLDGHEVNVQGELRTLDMSDAIFEAYDLTPVEQLINFVSNPTIASILLSLAMLGLIVELRTPGFGVPGILGMIFLLTALYALGQLDANFAGLALIALAMILFVAEAFTPTFGVLALGGAVAFIFGAALLFDTPGVEVPWVTIIALAVTLCALTLFVGVKALAAQRRPVITGSEMLIGQDATAKQAFSAGETGTVFLLGEWWNARLVEGALEKGEQAEVVGRDGYTLIVKRQS